MTKRKKEAEPVNHAKQWVWGILGMLVVGLAFGGWRVRDYIAEELATKSEVQVAQAQAQTALDTQMEDLMARIANLEAKKNKTSEDVRQIAYLRSQLDRLRKMRSIK